MAYTKNAYNRNKYGGMTPEQLVLAMYDGALRHLRVASDACRGPSDPGRKGTAVSKALAIVAELQAALNPEAGEFTERMLQLYDYVLTLISEGNVRNDPTKLDEAAGLLETVRSGWAEMIERGVAPEPPKKAVGAKQYV
jgi:flagellar protein FliS